MSHYLGILLWTEVVCSNCSKTMAGEFVRHGKRQMRMVMAEMEKEGWKNVNGEARCPQCQDSLTRAPEPNSSIELPTPFKGARY